MPLVRRRPLAGIAALGVVALLAGCGGGSDSAGGSDALSAAEFRTQADAICADFNRTSGGVADPTSSAEVLPYLKTILPFQQAELTKLEALTPPADLADTYTEALALLNKQRAAIVAATAEIEGGASAETVIAKVGPEIEALNTQADAKGKSLGLKVCGTDETEGATTTSSATTPASTTEAEAPATTVDTPLTTGTTGRYVDDVQAAATALQEFGSILQGASGIDDFTAKASDAEKSLDTFDAAIAKLAGYTLEVPKLEKQRAGLAETGPQVSDVLRRFVDAAGKGDIATVGTLVPEVLKTITEFQKAATG